ncbi:DUF3060 domain-containing protein [Roseomonas sp. OT10]|uniref:DUF3060 domain-containing protein n=1 Tax=Roseomonas cutis TaxID=2897332 RepID=UPI001E55B9DB|nr:DUF3060 domain-containing protein [Roseomonas sp. OT10]UFN49662.1 DUF3060 domain-containing protein [Roseomonas sp. OT10]
MRLTLPLALLAATVMAVPVRAAPLEIGGAMQSREVDCGGRDVTISGMGNRITLSGECGHIIVGGARHVIALPSAASLDVSGEGNSVTVSGKLRGLLLVNGAQERVEAGIGTGPDARVEVNGAEARLRLRLAGPIRISLAGARHEVVWTAPPGVPVPQAEISGEGNVLRRGD